MFGFNLEWDQDGHLVWVNRDGFWTFTVTNTADGHWLLKMEKAPGPLFIEMTNDQREQYWRRIFAVVRQADPKEW